jgi:hypothetical protein
MLKGHIACQRDSQAARLICNKCRDSATQRPYVRLRPLAYVTRGRSPQHQVSAWAGSSSVMRIGPHQAGLGHMWAPDPCLSKA